MTLFKKCRKILTIGLIIFIPLLMIKSQIFSAVFNTGPLTEEEIFSAIREDYPALVSSIKADPEAYGYKSADLEGIRFLNPVRFITADYSSDDLGSGKKLTTLHIPLINESQKILAIFTVIKSDSGINCTIGVDFAPMLNRAKQDGIMKAALLQTTSGLFAASLEGGYILDRNLEQVSGFSELQTLKLKSAAGPYVIIDLWAVNQTLTEVARDSR